MEVARRKEVRTRIAARAMPVILQIDAVRILSADFRRTYRPPFFFSLFSILR